MKQQHHVLSCINLPISHSAAGMVKTALWLINSDVGGTLIHAKDKNGDTPGHDAAENG